QLDRALGDAAATLAEIDADILCERRIGQRSGGNYQNREGKNSTRKGCDPHEEFFGRPSRDAISSSRFSKLVFCGAGEGASLRKGRAGGAGGGSGCTGGGASAPRGGGRGSGRRGRGAIAPRRAQGRFETLCHLGEILVGRRGRRGWRRWRRGRCRGALADRRRLGRLGRAGR